MSEEDLKLVLAKYQQKAFELYNTNIVLETQVEKLSSSVKSLSDELEKLKVKSKRATKAEEDFQ